MHEKKKNSLLTETISNAKDLARGLCYLKYRWSARRSISQLPHGDGGQWRPSTHRRLTTVGNRDPENVGCKGNLWGALEQEFCGEPEVCGEGSGVKSVCGATATLGKPVGPSARIPF